MNKYTFDEIEVGMQAEFVAKVKPEDMDNFCHITGDTNPLHCDKEYALRKGFEDRIVYGMLSASYLSTLAGIYLPGKESLIQSVEISFIRPIGINELLTIKGKVTEKNELFKIIKIKFWILNSKKEKVVRGKMQVGVLR